MAAYPCRFCRLSHSEQVTIVTIATSGKVHRRAGEMVPLQGDTINAISVFK